MDLPTAELIGIAVTLVFSGLFSSSETALTSLSDIRVEQILTRHPTWARSLRLWKNNPNGVLTTILIGNNLVNITASALATDVASQFFASQGIPIAIGVMTFALLVAGEITPKTLARTYSELAAPPLMNLIAVFHVLFFPASWVLTLFVRALLYLLGHNHRSDEGLTEDDIEFIVSLSGRQGKLDKDKELILSSVFDFSDTTAREIMVPRTDVVAVPIDCAYEEVVEVTLRSGFSRIPVYEGSVDHIVGIFYTKNLITQPTSEEQRAGFLKSRMRAPVYVPESKKISELLKMFQQGHMHMAVVVDEFGGTGGIVTMEDVIEELLGEIHDEFDVEEERLIQVTEGRYICDARLSVKELEDALDINFPEDRDYDSLGGFLMDISGDVPSVGWTHEFQSHLFRVSQADPTHVIKVEIERTVPTETPEDGEAPAGRAAEWRSDEDPGTAPQEAPEPPRTAAGGQKGE